MSDQYADSEDRDETILLGFEDGDLQNLDYLFQQLKDDLKDIEYNDWKVLLININNIKKEILIQIADSYEQGWDVGYDSASKN